MSTLSALALLIVLGGFWLWGYIAGQKIRFGQLHTNTLKRLAAKVRRELARRPDQ